MMPQEFERYLEQVRANLRLPQEQAEPILEELRAHLQSDFLDRLHAGQSEAEAIADAVRELGSPVDLARGLNAEHGLPARRAAMLRNIAAAMLSLLGFFGAVFTSDPWVLDRALRQLLPTTPSGVLLVYGWRALIHDGLWWMTQHPFAPALKNTLLQVLPMIIVGVLVGRISRGRGWILVLAPWLLFWHVTWLAVQQGKFTLDATIHVAQPLVQAGALLLGAQLGRRMESWHRHSRLALTGLCAALLGALCVIGFASASEGLLVTLVAMVGYASVLGILAWGAMALVHRWAARAEPDQAA